jgi:hypothetical protein
MLRFARHGRHLLMKGIFAANPSLQPFISVTENRCTCTAIAGSA